MFNSTRTKNSFPTEMKLVSESPDPTPNASVLMEPEYRVYDGMIAVGFCLCFLIGLPGNSLALRYFLQTKKRPLPILLYIVACCIDIGSSIIHLPVVANLLNKRNQGILKNTIFCSIWYFFLMLLQQMSMFVVMLLSLSRAIAILCPFYNINKKGVFASIAVYFLYQSVWDTLHIYSAEEVHYTAGFCQMYSESSLNIASQINFSITSGVPPIIVFVSFLVSITELRMTDATESAIHDRRNQRASETITFFAAIFLSCNLPTFLNNALFTFTMAQYERYPGPIYDNNFMYFYSWILSEIFCTVLNASLNPLLYFWRMKNMRAWLLGKYADISSFVSEQGNERPNIARVVD